MFNEVSGREFAGYQMRQAQAQAEKTRFLASLEGKSNERLTASVLTIVRDYLGNLVCYLAHKTNSLTNKSNSSLKPC